MVVYNVGDMKRRGSPAIKHGSSDSVTETGAQQGKSSSTVTIRQTEGNGQEKSSGRASAENVGKIERRSPPSFNGSSNSVDETGARRGNPLLRLLYAGRRGMVKKNLPAGRETPLPAAG